MRRAGRGRPPASASRAAAALSPCLVALLLAGVSCRAVRELDREPPRPAPGRGMVVCEHPLAAAVGAGVLERGGNAADAAVAAALALAVVYPQAGNLGGGGFAIVVPHAGEPTALDFREVAPALMRPELFFDRDGRPLPDRLRSGALSIGVPGTPAGLAALLARHGSGRFSLEDLADPAVVLARRGFAVDAVLARDLARPSVRSRLSESHGARARFYPGGEPLEEGETLVQPDLAATLLLYARGGPEGFYRGVTARRIATEVEGAAGRDPNLADVREGWLVAGDLAAYQPRWREPLRGWFRGREIVTMPPPSSGGIILLQVLAVLDGFPLEAERARALEERSVAAELGARGADAEASGLSSRIVHWWIETLRRSFAERAGVMGDPDFHAVPVEELLSPEWVARARVAIGDAARPAGVPNPAPEGRQTTHLSVLDPQGNAVSLTTTLNSSFGSGLLVEGAGFLLNNELDDFSLGAGIPNQFGLVGGEANAPGPRKRPLSSMTPTVVREGGHTVSLVLGSPGGPRIITAVTSVLLRVLVFDQGLAQAVAAPRFHQQWSPPSSEFEPGWPEPLLEGLRRRGHEVVVVDVPWASVQAIHVLSSGEVVGVSDPRRGGAAVAAE